MQSFSIIIVSWNGLHHLKRFLPSVCATDYPRYEVILSDNASTDGSKEWVTGHFPQVRIITHDRNYGYCEGNNRAVAHAKNDTLIFLNNDVEVTPNWLHPIAKILDRRKDVAAVQPKIRSWRQRDHFEYAGAAGGFIDSMGYPFCRGRIFDTVERDYGQYDSDIPIFWASGAALVIRSGVFKALGGFEESFRFHMEEIDLCWRVQRAGHKVLFCHDSLVYHLGAGSLAASNPQKTYFNFRNNLLMLARNLNGVERYIKILGRLELDGIAGVNFLFAGQLRNFYAVIRSHFGFYKRLGEVKKFRTKMNHLPYKPMASLDGTLKGSIVWRYMVRRHKTWDALFRNSEL